MLRRSAKETITKASAIQDIDDRLFNIHVWAEQLQWITVFLGDHGHLALVVA
jgi:hypothetical protein